MSKLFVLGTALIFFVYGLLFFVIPVETFQFMVDGTVTSSPAITDLRATYGGMSFGISVILFILGMNKQTLRIGLVSVFVVMFGMALGRSIGIIFDGDTNGFMQLYLALEVAACLVSLVLVKLTSENVQS